MQSTTKGAQVTTTNELKIITNHVPRYVLNALELTMAEREEFDYLDWDALVSGEDSASFFRYKGEVYDLGEFMVSPVAGWDGHHGDSYFSGMLVKYTDDGESVIVARYYQ